jgi:hypothetical protein
MAQFVDPTEGARQGLASLSNSLSNVYNMNRQDKLDAQNEELRGLQMQKERMTLEELKQRFQQQQELRSSLANAQPTTQFVPDQQTPSLGNIASGVPDVMQPPVLQPEPTQAQPQSVFNTPGKFVDTPVDRMKIIIDNAIKYGAYDEATKAITFETLAQNSAPDVRARTLAMEKVKELGLIIDLVNKIQDPEQLEAIKKRVPELMDMFPNGLEKKDISPKGIAVRDEEDNILGHLISHKDAKGAKVTQFVQAKSESSKTEEQLTAAALKGDTGAQAILDAMQKRKLSIAKENRAIITSNPMPGSGDRAKTYAISDEDAILLTKGIEEGRIDPTKINSRTAKVYVQMEKASQGNTNYVGAGANVKYKTLAANLQSRALMEGMDPLYDKLLAAGKTLGNSKIMGVNKVINWAKEQTGDPAIVGFNNLRDDVIAESERALMGSGVLSDNNAL